MAFIPDHLRRQRTEQFQSAGVRLTEMANEVDRLAMLLDESAINCESCGSTHYVNWPQRQLRARVTGAADRLREIGEVYKRRANDSDFLGDHSPGLARAALDAIDVEAKNANADGDVTLPSHVWDLVQQALGRGAVVKTHAD